MLSGKWRPFCQYLNVLTHLVLKLQYFGRTKSTPRLLMTWLLASPSHQQLWYWPTRTLAIHEEKYQSTHSRLRLFCLLCELIFRLPRSICLSNEEVSYYRRRKIISQCIWSRQNSHEWLCKYLHDLSGETDRRKFKLFSCFLQSVQKAKDQIRRWFTFMLSLFLMFKSIMLHYSHSTVNVGRKVGFHYGDVIMGAITSKITSFTIVYSSVYSDADQRKHQSSASLAFVWGIHRGLVNSPHKWPVTRKMFPFDDVIMCCSSA